MDRSPVIGVFGSSHTPPDDPGGELAYSLGQAIAQAGWVLCNGGYGGVMEASAKGARRAGGHTIGVSCTAFGRARVNPHIQEEIVTARLEDRLETLIARCDGYVILPGGTGTLVELAVVWELQNKRLAPKKPIVLLGEYWAAVIDAAARDDPAAAGIIQRVADVEQAVRVLSEALAPAPGAPPP